MLQTASAAMNCSVWAHRLLWAGGAVLTAAALSCSEKAPTAADDGTLHIAVAGLPLRTSAEVSAVAIGRTPETWSVPSDVGFDVKLPPGVYTVSAAPYTAASGDVYATSAGVTISATVTAAATSAVNVPYLPATGIVALSETGLDSSRHPMVSVGMVSGSAVTQLQSTQLPSTLHGLAFGSWLATAPLFSTDSDDFRPLPDSTFTFSLSASTPIQNVSFAFGPASARIGVAVSGLPAGTAAAVTLVGPKTYMATQSTTLLHVVPGTYTVQAAPVSVGSDAYASQVAVSQIVIAAGTKVVPLAVHYAPPFGALRVTVDGLPNGTAPSIAITGPNGFSAALASGGVTGHLAPGIYTIISQAVGGFTTAPLTQRATVVAGDTVTAATHYASNTIINFAIDDAFVIQSVQRPSRTVPLVADKAGLLRVEIRANIPYYTNAVVRVRLFSNGTLVQSTDLTSPAGVTIGSFEESNLLSTYNLTIPPGLMQPGLAVDAEVDPDRKTGEVLLADNHWPASGIPFDLGVTKLPTFRARLIPVRTLDTGVGDASDPASYLTLFRKIMPSGLDSVDLHAEFQSANAIGLGDAASYGRILAEMVMLWLVEGGTGYDYGVIHTLPTTVFEGYAGGSVAVGYDNPGDRANIYAHELGHDFGRAHSPGCGAADADPSYPYPNGNIGVTGYDVTTGQLVPPTTADLMTYCRPYWISDYNFTNIFTNRLGASTSVALTENAKRSLVVWGRVFEDSIMLEPAFDVTTRPSPPRPGPYRLTLLGANGEATMNVDFDTFPIADDPRGARVFGFTVPVSDELSRRVSALRVTGPNGRSSVRRAASSVAIATAIANAAVTGDTNIRWNGNGESAALVRDGATGEVIAVLRNGAGIVHNRTRSLDVTVSDGVRSNTSHLTVRQPQ
jgi:hypothetical protein